MLLCHLSFSFTDCLDLAGVSLESAEIFVSLPSIFKQGCSHDIK